MTGPLPLVGGARFLRSGTGTPWTLVLPARRDPPPGASQAPCPICAGHPARLLHLGDGGVRVLAHPYPALTLETPARHEERDGVERLTGPGAHELLVEAEAHDPGPAARLAEVLLAVQARMRDLRGDGRLRTLVWARDRRCGWDPEGRAHAASHLLALPLDPLPALPPPAGPVVVRRPGVVARVAAAPRSAWHLEIAPEPGGTRFEDTDPATVAAVGHVLARVLDRLRERLEAPPTSVGLAAPGRGEPHWRLVVRAGEGLPGGLADAAGVHVVSLAPDEAAAWLTPRGEAAR